MAFVARFVFRCTFVCEPHTINAKRREKNPTIAKSYVEECDKDLDSLGVLYINFVCGAEGSNVKVFHVLFYFFHQSDYDSNDVKKSHTRTLVLDLFVFVWERHGNGNSHLKRLSLQT